MDRTIPVGATLTRVYFALRTNPYTIGHEFDAWDDAVIAVQAAYRQRLTELTESLGGWDTPEGIAATAKSGVYLETRWTMSDPRGGSHDFMAERHPDVTKLRTAASFTA